MSLYALLFSVIRPKVIAVLVLSCSTYAAAQQAPLRIGVMPSAANEATVQAISQARQQGLEVKLVEFNDWVMPNIALANGLVDANFFQHELFLQIFNKRNGANLVSIAQGYSSAMGLFSKKLKRSDAVPKGATIALPNDPVNTERALLLLESMGLIALKTCSSHLATLQDVMANPRKLKLIQIKQTQSTRIFNEATAVVACITFAKRAGLSKENGLKFDNENPDPPMREYAIRWVTTLERAHDPRLLKFIDIYQRSPEVKAILYRLYGDLVDFPW